MSRKQAQSRLQSWVNAIPLGSLDQLQSAVRDDTQREECSECAVTVPLPDSRPSSFEDAGLYTSSILSPAHPKPEPTGQDVLRSNLLANTARSDEGSLPQSIHTTVPAPASTGGQSLRTASAGSLWQLENAGIPVELRAPLPESVASSEAFNKSHSGSQAAASSLAPSPAVGPRDSLDRHQHPPNDSNARGQIGQRQQESSPNDLDYWNKMADLTECLPQLDRIDRDHGRHEDVGFISCVDYFKEPTLPKTRTIIPGDLSRNRRPFADRVRRLNVVSDPNIITRVILVEDLSPRLIEALGSTFRIDPAFFAEHLIRSGYDGMDHDEKPPPKWDVSNTWKAHTAMKWYRPVQQNPQVTEWLKTPHLLLDRRAVSIDDDDKKRIPRSVTWYDTELDGPEASNKDIVERQVVIGTNVFRRCWSLSTRPITQEEDSQKTARKVVRFRRKGEKKIAMGVVHASGDREYGSWERLPISTAWEEKVSYFRYSEADVPIIILLLDPIPAMTETRRTISRDQQGRRHRSAPKREPYPMFLPMVPRSPVDFPRNKYDMTKHDIQRMKRSKQKLDSTLEAILAQSQSLDTLSWQDFRADPILALLRVVRTDSKAFFSSIETALDEISQDSLDDYLMTRRLADWRKLMSDLEIEVPAIGESVREFVDMVFQSNQGPKPPKQVNLIVEEIEECIEHVNKRLVEAYTALRADMQFTESRRSISEAKTVTKLTELAFLFIPLSFTCSLFSMSIRELQNGVPVWTFILTAVVLALLSYTVRLVIASDYIADISRRALEKFWARRNVRRGDNAPLFTFLLLTLQEFWTRGGARFILRCSLCLFMATFIVLPVTFMWTSTTLVAGFNVAMTLLLVLPGTCFIWFLYLVTGDDAGEGSFFWQGGMYGRTGSDSETEVSSEDV